MMDFKLINNKFGQFINKYNIKTLLFSSLKTENIVIMIFIYYLHQYVVVVVSIIPQKTKIHIF
jgi:hypothetical protein